MVRPAPEDRFIIRETELDALASRFPALSRAQIMHTIARAGPNRAEIEAALARMSSDASNFG